MKNKILGIGLTVLGLALATFITVHANPSQIPVHSNCSTASATTSTQLIATSTPTYTLTCDAYNLATGYSVGLSLNSASLAFQISATSSIINMNLQYSNDGIDWYDNEMVAQGTSIATTTITNPTGYTLTAGTSKKIVRVDTPTRYVRAIFNGPAGQATTTIWAEFIPKQEIR